MEWFTFVTEGIVQFLDILLHIDVYLKMLVQSYGIWIYLILFVIVFCETGLVVTPFLPGDSLLFAGGALAGAGMLHYPVLVGILLGAAIIGDSVNYRIGRWIGPPVFAKNYRWLKKKHLEQAHQFYEKHGGKAIVLARFIPVIRTFAPFVAGVAGMWQSHFLFFNITGACVWVFSLVSLGYFFGNSSFVQANFSLVIYAIIVISVMPVCIEWVRHLLRTRAARLK